MSSWTNDSLGLFFFLSFLIKLMFWNVRGVGGRGFYTTIKAIRRIYNLDFLAIFRPQISGSRDVEVINSLGFDNSFYGDAIEFSKGIWLLWNDWLNIQIVHSSFQAITAIIHSDDLVWALSTIYASSNANYRKLLWDHLNDIVGCINSPSLLTGDFI